MSETRSGGPTVLRMILGKQLQALREKAGLSFEEAAEAIYSSPWTVRRMERAEGGLKPLTVKALLMAYGITDVREIDAFLALAREASKPGWWHTYGDVLPTWFRTSVGLEEAACLIRGYEPQCVPGLLQTEDYARAIIGVGFPDATAAEIDRLIQVRMTRQSILTRANPPRIWFVLEETTLRRSMSGHDVMRCQIDRLIEATEQANITVQVLPLSAGPHPGMYGLFQVFRFPAEEMPDIVYGENMTSAYYLDQPQDTAVYLEALDRMCAQANPASQTKSTLHNVRKEI